MEDNIVEIAPPELYFPPPLNRLIVNVVLLKNLSNEPVAYKVKTTAPKKYAVRPNNGILEPHDTKELQVLLQAQPGDEVPTPQMAAKDKFQVQAVVISARDADTIATAFKDTGAIMETRLRVVFGEPKPNAPKSEFLKRRSMGDQSMMSITSSVAGNSTFSQQSAYTQQQQQQPHIVQQPVSNQPQVQQQQPVVVSAAPVQATAADMQYASQQPTQQLPTQVTQPVVPPITLPATTNEATKKDLERKIEELQKDIAASRTETGELRQRRPPVDGSDNFLQPPSSRSSNQPDHPSGGITLSMLHLVLLCALLFLAGRLSNKFLL